MKRIMNGKVEVVEVGSKGTKHFVPADAKPFLIHVSDLCDLSCHDVHYPSKFHGEDVKVNTMLMYPRIGDTSRLLVESCDIPPVCTGYGDCRAVGGTSGGASNKGSN